MKRRILALLFGIAFGVVPTTLAQFTQQWARIYPSLPGQFAEAVDVQMDAVGNIYTLGLVVNDMLLIKYNPAGDTVWTRRVINGGRPLKMELDSNGDIIIGGGSPGIRKYSSAGNLLWMNSVPGGVYTLSLDSANNVCAAGRDNLYTHVRKFGSNGDSLWAKRYTGIGAGSIPTASTTDGAGNFYLAALYNPNQTQGILIIKYLPNGDTAWTRVYTRLSFTEWANDIQVDNSGNIVVAGWASTGFQPSTKDYAVVKYGPTGVLVWQRHFNGADNGEDQINDIDIDEVGDIYATGRMGTTAATVKLSAVGDSLWVVHEGSQDSRNATMGGGKDCRRVSVIRQGSRPSIEFILWLVTYDDEIEVKLRDKNDGELRGAIFYPTQLGQEQVMGNGGVYVFNSPTNPGSTLEVIVSLHRVAFFPPASFIHTVKFTSPLTSVNEGEFTPSSFSLHQNYPNPFNPGTTIAFSIPYTSAVVLKIYDILGHEVETLINGTMLPGQHSVNWDATGHASGVYFCRFTAGSYAETRKLLLMK